MPTADLWAITSYFNPAGYTTRRENYRLFRRHLNVPLVAVELSFTGGFELVAGDADVLVQIHGGDVMWQKERLLNIAIGCLPPGCTAIAWIDCDVLFARDTWAVDACRALEEHAMVHLFEERRNLPGPVSAPLQDLRTAGTPAQSVVSRLSMGTATPEDLSHANAPMTRGSTAGLAWAGRREVLERHGLYDACIVGTGDRVMLCAALGRFDDGIAAALMNRARAAHYRAWAAPFFETVTGRVGRIPGTICHLWHGHVADRCYEERHRLLATFDPSADIALDEHRCWRWSSDKPEMHAQIRRYFELRNEDRPGCAAP
jgi:hypothetical protein